MVRMGRSSRENCSSVGLKASQYSSWVGWSIHVRQRVAVLPTMWSSSRKGPVCQITLTELLDPKCRLLEEPIVGSFAAGKGQPLDLVWVANIFPERKVHTRESRGCGHDGL